MLQGGVAASSQENHGDGGAGHGGRKGAGRPRRNTKQEKTVVDIAGEWETNCDGRIVLLKKLKLNLKKVRHSEGMQAAMEDWINKLTAAKESLSDEACGDQDEDKLKTLMDDIKEIVTNKNFLLDLETASNQVNGGPAPKKRAKKTGAASDVKEELK